MSYISAFKGRAEKDDPPSRAVPISNRKYSDGTEFGKPGHGLEVFARGLKLPGRKTPPTAPAPMTPTPTTTPAAPPATSTVLKWAQEAAKLVGSVAPMASPAITPLLASTKKKSQTLKEREEAGRAGRANDLAIACRLGLNLSHFSAAVREGSFPPPNFTSERTGEMYWDTAVAKQAISTALAAQTN